jgi:catechol 2,3-dioxygenase-like lactoylglutathione lyase family enzyme
MSKFPALAHVALTVSNLPTSVAWYRRLIGADPVLDEDTGPFHHVAFAIGGGAPLALHGFPNDGANRLPSSAPRFNEQHEGLDHVAFGRTDRAELEKWQRHLDDIGVAHGEIVDAHYGSGMSVRDPDNIALELFAPPTPPEGTA